MSIETESGTPRRRSILKGASWAAPTAAASLAAPVYAASACSTASRSVIDAAFDEVRTTALTAYASEATQGNLNGLSKSVWLNINNTSKYDVALSGNAKLQIQIDSVRADGTATASNSGSPATAWGTVTPMTTGTSTITSPSGAQQTPRTTTWTASNLTIPANASGNDNEPDMTIASGTGAVILRYTLVSAPVIVPSLASIAAQSGTNLDGCTAYYNQKVASAQPVTISFAGPKLTSGTARWGSRGSVYTLTGGATPWAVGTSIWSSQTGNYTSDVFPPKGAATGISFDGIY